MATALTEYEGTWEEIATHAPEFRGRRLRLLVLADEPSPSPSLDERRAFLKLPIEERRPILAQQAGASPRTTSATLSGVFWRPAIPSLPRMSRPSWSPPMRRC